MSIQIKIILEMSIQIKIILEMSIQFKIILETENSKLPLKIKKQYEQSEST